MTRERWSRAPMDVAYLDRLAEGAQPDGDLVSNVFRFSEGEDAGEVAIWQVQVRGDDMLEVLRLARHALTLSGRCDSVTDAGEGDAP